MKAGQIVIGVLLVGLIVLVTSTVNAPIDDEIYQNPETTELNFTPDTSLSRSSEIQMALFSRESSPRYVGRTVRNLSSRGRYASIPPCRIPNGSSNRCDCDTDSDCPSGYYCP
mgnify:CR=1 FL=1